MPDRGSVGWRKLATLSAVAILMFSWPQAAHPLTVNGTLNVTGRATAPASGPCAVSGFTACPDDNCICVQVPGAKIAGSATGNADLSATIDNGEADSSAGCTPVYVSFTATATVPTVGSATVAGDLFLVQCANGTLEGGTWGITASSGDVGGSGTVSGKFDGSKGKVALKLTGTITLP